MRSAWSASTTGTASPVSANESCVRPRAVMRTTGRPSSVPIVRRVMSPSPAAGGITRIEAGLIAGSRVKPLVADRAPASARTSSRFLNEPDDEQHAAGDAEPAMRVNENAGGAVSAHITSSTYLPVANLAFGHPLDRGLIRVRVVDRMLDPMRLHWPSPSCSSPAPRQSPALQAGRGPFRIGGAFTSSSFSFLAILICARAPYRSADPSRRIFPNWPAPTGPARQMFLHQAGFPETKRHVP